MRERLEDRPGLANAASGCASQWKVIGAADFNGDGHVDLLWHNATSGVVGAWLLDSRGHVSKAQNLSWKCDAASGCSQAWKAVGITSEYVVDIR